jgi:hypothetical protein
MMVKGRRGMNGAMPRDTGEVQGLRIGYKFHENSMKPKPLLAVKSNPQINRKIRDQKLIC